MWKICKILKTYRTTPTFYNCTNKKQSICDHDSQKKKSIKNEFGKDENQEKENLTVEDADFFKFSKFFTESHGGYTNRSNLTKSFGSIGFGDTLFLNIASALYVFNSVVDREKSGPGSLIWPRGRIAATNRTLAILPLVDPISISTNQNAPHRNHVASQTEPSRDNSSTNQNTSNDIPCSSRDQCAQENFHINNDIPQNHQLISTFHNLIGVDMIESGLYPEAFEQFQKAAVDSQSDTGDTNASAVYNLGMCYMKGYGTGQNMSKAIECWSRAAQLGHSFAKYQMAVYYFRVGAGEYDPEKFAYLPNGTVEKAGQLLKQAAEDGEIPEAQSLYGLLLYKQGHRSKAVDFLRKADQSGNEQASRVLRLIESQQVKENLAFKVKNVQKPVPNSENHVEPVHFFNDQSESSSSSDSSIVFEEHIT